MQENSINHFTISIAGMVVKINTMYSRTYWLCKDYICTENPDFEISITEQDLLEEQFFTLGSCDRHMGGYLEPGVVHRKIVEKAIDYNCFMIHGAAIALNKEAYVFCGASGVGKTTHICKWLDQNKETFVINGDKPLIRYIDDSFFVCGTPWSGKEHMNTNEMIRLNSLIFMTRDDNNSFAELSFSNALPFLLRQTYIYKDETKLKKSFDLFTKMSETVRFFRFFSNNLKDDSFQVSYNALVCDNL